MGGEPLRDAGAKLLYDSTPLSTIGTASGVSVLLRRGFELMAKLREVKRLFRDDPPDLVALVDNAGVNLRLLSLARRYDIPVLYYVPPELWSLWGLEVPRIVRARPRVAAIFASQAEQYRRLGLDAEWVGHPLLDLIRSHPPAPAQVDGPPTIGLFPGSRRQEIVLLLPKLRDAVERIRRAEPAASFILCCANPMARDLVRAQASGWPEGVEIRYRDSYRTLSQCHLALACSGTVTLEAALLGVPTIAMYRIKGLLDNLIRAVMLPLAKYPHFSLPNVIAGRGIVPELANRAVTGERIAAEAQRLLRDAAARAGMIEALHSIRPMLGPPGAVQRTADLIQQMLAQRTKAGASASRDKAA